MNVTCQKEQKDVGYPFFFRLNNQFTQNAYVYLLHGLGASGTVPCSCMMPGETLEPARERESGTGRSILAEDE